MTTDLRPPKVLLTKIGLDGHDRGGRVVATYLRDAGMEVVFTGPWKTIPEVIATAQEEDVDVIGISSLAADHLLVPKLMTALGEHGLGHIGVVVGGIVPDRDEQDLLAVGVAGVFHPGASLEEIVPFVDRLAKNARQRRSGL
jgi:methylmalonyl-CoA mutase C-terminal domain/subunit